MDVNHIYKILSYVFWTSGVVCGVATIIYAVRVKIWNVIKNLNRYETVAVSKYNESLKTSAPINIQRETAILMKHGETVPLSEETRVLFPETGFQVIYSQMYIHSDEIIG